MHWMAVLILLVQLAVPIFPDLSAQAAAEIRDLGVNYRFGEQITFQATIETDTPVQEALVFIKPEGQQTAWQTMIVEDVPAPDDSGNAVKNIFTAVETGQLTLYPFSEIEYHYEVTLEGGAKVSSDYHQFVYEDNRFPWSTTENGSFQVSWYSDDAALGQAILNVAERGLKQARTLLDTEMSGPLRIYAYASSGDLQTALQLNNQPWVAGHATPELGMILISVPDGPEQTLELERQVPHEIMHIQQYQVMGDKYVQQPVWLVEGMASLNELYPNPEYQRVLEATASAKNLLPMSSLCVSFPHEAAGAFLAYAQSESFVRFLQQKYGASGLRSLIDQYQNGLGCEEGFTAALGVSIKQLEYRWKQESLGVDLAGLVIRNLSPYLIIGLLLLAPVALAFVPFRSSKPKTMDKQL